MTVVASTSAKWRVRSSSAPATLNDNIDPWRA
jgi:hypothetical protein